MTSSKDSPPPIRLTLTRLTYSFIFSLYNCAASAFAGLSFNTIPSYQHRVSPFFNESCMTTTRRRTGQEQAKRTDLFGFGSFNKLCTLVKIATTS
jgi:hypothetical protein